MLKRIHYFPILILIAVLLFIDWYAFQGVKVLTASTDWRSFIHYGYWLFSTGLIFLLGYTVYRVLPTRKFTRITNLVFNTFLALLVSKLVFILVLLCGDIIRVLVAILSGLKGNPFLLPLRSEYVSEIGLALAAIPFFAFIFGVTKGKYHYQVHRKTLYFDDLPAAFDGFTITQISDIHAGSFDNFKAVQRGVELIKAQQSDLFVFTGDLVNNRAEEILPWIDLFKQIKAKYGQFSIVGNHDYGDYISWSNREEKIKNFERLKQYHAQLGFRLLLDEHMKIEKDGQTIALIGVENWGLGFGQRGNLQKALRGVEQDAFKVLLSHDPSHWDEQVKNNPLKIHLTLSGHTHGMQFGIEVWGFKWSPVKYRYHNWAGLTQENERFLYVNRGFGFLGFSGRVGIWPEITVIQLKKKI